MADAMEMMILSILAPALHCDWKLPPFQQALLTTVTIKLFFVLERQTARFTLHAVLVSRISLCFNAQPVV